MDVTDVTARLARVNTRLLLGLWGATPAAAEDLEQIVGELAAHTVRYGRSGTVAVSLDRVRDTLTVRVEATGHAPHTGIDPRITDSPADDSPGLTIVSALATRWGCDTTPHGTTVWAESDLKTVTPPGARHGSGPTPLTEEQPRGHAAATGRER